MEGELSRQSVACRLVLHSTLLKCPSRETYVLVVRDETAYFGGPRKLVVLPNRLRSNAGLQSQARPVQIAKYLLAGDGNTAIAPAYDAPD